MALTSKRKVDAEKFKLEIAKHWEIMDHGPINWFLGFQIRRDRKARTISINQQAYIESMVEKFRLTGAKRVSTPMEANAQFSVQQSPVDSEPIGPYAKRAIQRGHRQCIVAGRRIQARRGIRCWDIVTVHSEPRSSSLGSLETSH